jgi:hypothetical protein
LILLIWDFRSDNWLNEKIFFTSYALAVTCFYLSLMLLVRLLPVFRWTLIAVQIVAWAAFIVASIFIWFEPSAQSTFGEFLGKTGIILMIFIAALTVLIPVFHFVSRGRLGGENDSVEKIDEEIAGLKAKIEELESRKLKLTGGSGQSNS